MLHLEGSHEKAVGYAGNLRCVQQVSSTGLLVWDKDHHAESFVAWSKALPRNDRSRFLCCGSIYIYSVFEHLRIWGNFIFLSWEKVL